MINIIYLVFDTYEEAEIAQAQIQANRVQSGIVDIKGETILEQQVTSRWDTPLEREIDGKFYIQKPEQLYMSNVVNYVEETFEITNEIEK